MLPGEIALLAFIIAAFTVFAVTLAWVSHSDGADRTAAARRAADRAAAAAPTTSYQGADG